MICPFKGTLFSNRKEQILKHENIHLMTFENIIDGRQAVTPAYGRMHLDSTDVQKSMHREGKQLRGC